MLEILSSEKHPDSEPRRFFDRLLFEEHLEPLEFVKRLLVCGLLVVGWDEKFRRPYANLDIPVERVSREPHMRGEYIYLSHQLYFDEASQGFTGDLSCEIPGAGFTRINKADAEIIQRLCVHLRNKALSETNYSRLTARREEERQENEISLDHNETERKRPSDLEKRTQTTETAKI
jgi:hypothetical protein